MWVHASTPCQTKACVAAGVTESIDTSDRLSHPAHLLNLGHLSLVLIFLVICICIVLLPLALNVTRQLLQGT
jgi:hypothetical protein